MSTPPIVTEPSRHPAAAPGHRIPIDTLVVTSREPASSIPAPASRLSAGLHRHLVAAMVALLAMFAVRPAPGQGLVKAIQETRIGSVDIVQVGGGSPVTMSVPAPAEPFGSVDFDECLEAFDAVGCLTTESGWLGDLPQDFSTDGYTSSGSFTLDPSGGYLVFAKVQATIVILVDSLGPGQTVAFRFHGHNEDPGGNSFTTLTGPGVSITHEDGAPPWDQVVNLVNGQYTLSFTNTTVASGAGLFEGSHEISLERLNPGPNCGSPGTGSCFEASGGLFCDDVTCCVEVCSADSFCCTAAWDEICVQEAGLFCLPDVPLCMGASLDFALGDDAIVPQFGLWTATQEITIEFWQRIDSTSTGGGAIACQSSLSNRIVTHTPWVSGEIIFDFGAAFGGGRLVAPAPAGLLGTWHHFAFVASVSGQFMRIYHNGQLLAESDSATPFSPVDVPLIIADSFEGALDEVRIWGVARTAEQIAANWDREVAQYSAGLRLYYRMDSALETSPLLVDRSVALPGDGQNATIVGAPQLLFEPGCAVDLCDDGSLVFDGTTGHVNVGPMADFGAGVGESTLEFWVRTSDTGTPASPIKIIDDRPGAGDPVYGIDFNRSIVQCAPSGLSPGRTLFFLRDNDLKVAAIEIDVPIYDDLWHHIAWRIVDSSTSHMEVYVDGVLAAPVATCWQSPSAFTPWSDSLVIGASNNRGTIERFMSGWLDEVRIYDVALTPAELQARWQGEIHPSTPGLVSYWRFDEGAGNAAADFLGLAPGTLVGGATWSPSNPCDPLVLFGDLDGSGLIDGADLGILLSNWGGAGVGDLDGNGVVDGGDLGLLLGAWS